MRRVDHPALRLFSKTTWAFFGFLTLISSVAYSRDFVFNTPGTENFQEVRIQNKSRETQPVWLVFYEDDFKEEYYFEVPARSTRILSLDGLKKPAWTFAIVTKSSLVTPLPSKTAWEQNPATRYEVKLKSSMSFELQLYNLFPEKQDVQLRYLDSFGKVLSHRILKTAGFRRPLDLFESSPANASLLVIESDHPLLVTSDLILKPTKDSRRPATLEKKYFLVQNGTGGTNFVAPIEDPELIALARKEIIDPQGFILFADLEVNPLQANRNFASPEKTYWSWSIKRVTGLAQIGADWCHAYPEMIERMLQRFLRQEQVCFRGQRIIRELKPSEVEQGILNERP